VRSDLLAESDRVKRLQDELDKGGMHQIDRVVALSADRDHGNVRPCLFAISIDEGVQWHRRHRDVADDDVRLEISQQSFVFSMLQL
jgi:hypothetical protein